MLIYKYRGGNREIQKRDIRCLARSELYAARLQELNDVMEAFARISDFVDLEKRMRTKLRREFGSKQFDERCAQIAREAHAALSLEVKAHGIYSLSASPVHELLWAHYADASRGFCLAYDLEVLLASLGPTAHSIKVRYSELVPTVNESEWRFFRDAATNKVIGTKSTQWSYEQEIRIVTETPGIQIYDPRALKAIYFGSRCPVLLQKLIMRVTVGRGLRYFAVKPRAGRYQLLAEELYG